MYYGLTGAAGSNQHLLSFHKHRGVPILSPCELT